jgi:predicted metalloendopeptidase
MFYMVGQDFINIPQLQGEYAPLNALFFAMKNARYYMYRQIAEFVGLQNIQKEKCAEIMEKCRQIMHDRIENLEWMSSTTKQAALKKLSEMLFFIGYPDKWNEDFTPVVEGNTLLETVSSLRQQNTQILRKLIGRSDVESSWDFWCYMVTFNTYNAMYMPSANELIILPAFLMAPMFDITQSDATLYGTAYVFAHEMCHGFDARGAEYDEYGNKRDWWTAEDNAKFKEKQQQLIDLWGQLEHMPGLPANGKNTLTENMADYGGAILASEAYKMRLKEQGYSDKGIDIQMKKFFSSFGLNVIVFEHERNPEMLRRLYDTDEHSAGHNRVNGIVRLFDDWYRLYDVQPEDKLYLKPKDRVKIW